jgi:hypothetical protein
MAEQAASIAPPPASPVQTNVQRSATTNPVNQGAANSLGIGSYGSTGTNVSPGTAPTPGAPTVPVTNQNFMNIAPPANNPNEIPQLDPSIQNQVVSISTQGQQVPGAQIKTQGKKQIAMINQMLEVKQLLTAYSDMYKPNVSMTGDDVKALKALGNKQINRFLDAFSNTGTTPAAFLQHGGSALPPGGTIGPPQSNTFFGPVLGQVESFFNVGRGGPPSGPSNRQITTEMQKLAKQSTGFSTPNELKQALITAIAKKIPGINVKSLADPQNAQGLVVPASLMDQLTSTVNASLRRGMTFNDLWNAADPTTKQPIIKASAVQRVQNALKNTANVDMGSQTAESAYQGLIKIYQQDPSQVVTWLQNAGQLLPGPNGAAPTPYQIYSSLAQVVTQAAQTKTSVSNLMTNKTNQFNGNQDLNQAEVGPQASLVSAAAANLGVQLTSDQLTGLTTKAIQGSWSNTQIEQAVAGFYAYQPGVTQTGRAGQILDGMQTLAQQYLPGTTLSTATIGEFLTNAIKGIAAAGQTGAPGDPMDAAGDSMGTSAALANFRQYVQQQAMSQFPEFTNQIAQGIKTQTLVDPYAQLAASLLGYGAVSGQGQASIPQMQDATASLGINWNDPKWNRFLKGGADGRPMSMDQARQIIITDPQYNWASTDMAANLAAHVGDSMMETFGFVKPGGTTTSLG